MFSIGLTLILALSLYCCSATDGREEAAVYAVYINAHLISNPITHKPYSMIVIKDHSSGLENRDILEQEIKRLLPKPDPQTLKNFFARNARYFGGLSLESFRNGFFGRRRLNADIRFEIRHVLITDGTVGQIFGDGGWEEFNRRFPNCQGIVNLSRAGFNKNNTEALLYVGNQWDWLAGEGRIVLFQKKGGEWTEVATGTCWVS